MEQTNTLNYVGDFRSEAILASIRFCKNAASRSAHRDLTQFKTSLCLPASDDPIAEKRAVGRGLIKWFSLMATLLLGGGGMLYVALCGPLVTPIGSIHFPIWAGAIALLAGWAMTCGSVNAEHWIARRHIAARGADLPPFPVSEKSLMFRIEDPATFKTIKLVIEDVTIGWCDARRRVIQLEGFAYRYVIWAKDLLSLNQLGDRFVEVKFFVGESDTVVSLAVALNGLTIELKKQLSFGTASRAVEAPLHRVFGFPIPWSRG